MRLAEPRWHSRYLCGQVARTRERKVSAVASDAAAWTGACCSDPMLRVTTAAAEAEPQMMTVLSRSGASLTRLSPFAKALERLQVRMSMGMPSLLHLPRGQSCDETHGCAEVPAIHAPEMRFASAFFTAAGPWCHWTGAAVAVAGANAPSISHTTDVCTKSIARM